MMKNYYDNLPADHKEFIKYFLVTGIATIADFITLLLLRKNFNISLGFANIIAFCIGVTLNYALTIIFVFSKSKFKSRAFEIALFIIIGIAGLYVNTFVLTLLAQKYMIGEPIAKFFATGVSFIFNFVLKKLLLFKR